MARFGLQFSHEKKKVYFFDLVNKQIYILTFVFSYHHIYLSGKTRRQQALFLKNGANLFFCHFSASRPRSLIYSIQKYVFFDVVEYFEIFQKNMKNRILCQND